MYNITITEKAKKEHFLSVKDIIRKNAMDNDTRSMIIEQTLLDEYDIFCQNLQDDSFLWNLVCGTPDILMEIVKGKSVGFEEAVEDKRIQFLNNNDMKPVFQKIFNYKTFVSRGYKGAYALTKNLGVKVCPYCNRSFVSTVIIEDENAEKELSHEEVASVMKLRKCITRPELDHYFPKDRYPVLALSIYNLIPCCHICNSNIKGTRELNLEEHYHPYISHDEDIHFDITLNKIGDKEIKLKYGSEKAKKTAEFFMLDEIYKHHGDEAEHLFNLFEEYPDRYLIELTELLIAKNMIKDKRDLVDMLYDHFNVKDSKSEILGGLRKDLYDLVISLYSNI